MPCHGAGPPGWIALQGKHPEAEAVKNLSYAGLVPTVHPWMQALIWAFKPTGIVDIRLSTRTGPRERSGDRSPARHAIVGPRGLALVLRRSQGRGTCRARLSPAPTRGSSTRHDRRARPALFGYAVVIWLRFFKLRWLTFSITWGVVSGLVGLYLLIIFLIGLRFMTPYATEAKVIQHPFQQTLSTILAKQGAGPEEKAQK